MSSKRRKKAGNEKTQNPETGDPTQGRGEGIPQMAVKVGFRAAPVGSPQPLNRGEGSKRPSQEQTEKTPR